MEVIGGAQGRRFCHAAFVGAGGDQATRQLELVTFTN